MIASMLMSEVPGIFYATAALLDQPKRLSLQIIRVPQRLHDKGKTGKDK